MKYEVKFTSGFKKSFKKLNAANKNLFYEILYKLAAGKTLESKYKNHKLKGKYSGCNECHIKPDLLLIYEKNENALILICIDIGSHSELFK